MIRTIWLVVLRIRQPHHLTVRATFDRLAVDDELDGAGVTEDEVDALLVREGLGLGLFEHSVEE